MSLKRQCLYDFGEFRLDPARKTLLRGEKHVSITPKVFETLVVLIENAGQTVEKEELMKAVWKDRFVEDSNLTFNIKMLRKALGDSAADPRYIETVPRRGYRFIAAVNERSEAEKSPAAARAEPAPRDAASQSLRAGRIFRRAAALALLLFATAAAGYWAARNHTLAAAPILTKEFSAEKVSSSGNLRHAVISPDGKFFVYANVSGGKQSVWLKKFESADNIQIIAPSDNLYFGFAFADDGQTLYFVRRPASDETAASVYRMPVIGGVAEKIIDQTEGKISLSPDGRQLSFVRCEKREENFCALVVADADGGGREREIFVQKSPFRITDNQFSPDGRSIAFAAGQSLDGGSDYRLKLINPATGELSDASPKTFFLINSLRWLPDNTGVLLTAKENLNEKYHVWQISTVTGEARKLTKDAAEYASVSLSRNGDKLLATQLSDNFRLYLSANGETTALTNAWDATFAPDGNLYYMAGNDIWNINADGTNQRQLTNHAASDFSPVVSPDNRSIYFASNRSGSNQVWRMNADGTNQTQLTAKTGGYPRFVSPDGRWIYYESGFHRTVWKVAADGGAEIEVSKTKMSETAFSPDGAHVAYLFWDKTQKIGILRIADQQIVKVIADDDSRFGKLAWSPDSRTLNFVVERAGAGQLWRQALAAAAARLVTGLDDERIKSLSVSPDDRVVAYTAGEWLSDAVLIEGLR